MTDRRQLFEAEMARFRKWADASPIPHAEQSGEWACSYYGWEQIYSAFDAFVAGSPCHDWDRAVTELILYAVARDSDINHLVKSVASKRDNLLCLAERAILSPEYEAKWQIVAELGRLGAGLPQVEPLLLQYMEDGDEYVRRRAFMALADIGSAHASEQVEPAWHTGDEYQRIAVLYVLRKIGSPQLDTYLALAEADGRQYLIDYVARIRAGNPD